MIRMGETDYPQSPSDGVLVLDNTDLGKYEDESFEVGNLVENHEYFFTAFPYSVHGVYRVSSDEANRYTATPKGGEQVEVSVEIDDASGFTSAEVRCVNETNPVSTQVATITAEQRTATFTVSEGDTYHIEYGAVANYAQPANTAPKVAVAGATSTYGCTYCYFTATINVTYPSGATVTCALGSKLYTAPNTSGSYAFKVHEVGTWTVQAIQGSSKDSETVTITTDGQSVNVSLTFINIYGITRNIQSSSPTWARTDKAVGMTATASVGTSAGSSSFDNCYPWSGIKRETLSTGDVMVKIPRFYYKRTRVSGAETIQIADGPADGFSIHPAFTHDGMASSCIYVGAYLIAKGASYNKYVSLPGKAPVDSGGMTNYYLKQEKGAGWYGLDYSTISAIQMLILVEFATYDVQSAIGKGYVDAAYSGTTNTGGCDSVPNLTGRPAGTDGRTNVVWRGIEDFWGNAWQTFYGLVYRGSDVYYGNNPEKYSSTMDSTNGLRYVTGATIGYGYMKYPSYSSSYPFLMLPSEKGASASTYTCDYGDVHEPGEGVTDATYYSYFGGGPLSRDKAGLFCFEIVRVGNTFGAKQSTRMIYIPQ